jgi:hypothetical protein
VVKDPESIHSTSEVPPVPRPTPPPTQTLRSQAAKKRNAAERREKEAARMRAEAAELEWLWQEHLREQAERRAEAS